jgi:hypothetical protein
MKYFGNIYLSWRRGIGQRRYIVGVIKKNSTQGVVFAYLPKGVKDASYEGFTRYTEFPDTTQVYTNHVLEILGQRLTPPERLDSKKLYTFWQVPVACYSDPFSLLAFTQGWLPTDNFEFLANFNPVTGLNFVTDLAGLSFLKLPVATIKVGDKLDWRYERDNQYDKFAVAVFLGEMKVGYIKKAHARIFHKKHHERIKLNAYSIERNGIIKKLFISVSL